jgi:hypothetical protein
MRPTLGDASGAIERTLVSDFVTQKKKRYPHFSRFHFDTAAGAGEVRPCEAAYIASLEPSLKKNVNVVPPNVVVLVQ